MVVGAAAAAVHSLIESPAETTAGKIANAALGGGAGALTMVNPWVAGETSWRPRVIHERAV